MAEGGALTLLRSRREGLVRTRKEGERESATHSLDIEEGGTFRIQKEGNRERPLTNWKLQRGVLGHRERTRKGHSHPGEYRQKDSSGHRKKASLRGHSLPRVRGVKGQARIWTKCARVVRG